MDYGFTMKIEPKDYTLEMSHEELVCIQLAIALLLEDEVTHERWKTTLQPVNEQMREILRMEDCD